MLNENRITKLIKEKLGFEREFATSFSTLKVMGKKRWLGKIFWWELSLEYLKKVIETLQDKYPMWCWFLKEIARTDNVLYFNMSKKRTEVSDGKL